MSDYRCSGEFIFEPKPEAVEKVKKWKASVLEAGKKMPIDESGDADHCADLLAAIIFDLCNEGDRQSGAPSTFFNVEIFRELMPENFGDELVGSAPLTNFSADINGDGQYICALPNVTDKGADILGSFMTRYAILLQVKTVIEAVMRGLRVYRVENEDGDPWMPVFVRFASDAKEFYKDDFQTVGGVQ